MGALAGGMMDEQGQDSQLVVESPSTISAEAFHELTLRRAEDLLRLANYLASCSWDRPVFTRPLLGELLEKSTELEELLDAYFG